MAKGCGVIIDLIPLYLDGVCSEESCKLIEAHVEECEDCQQLLEKMRTGLTEEVQEPLLNIPKEEIILKETSWSISKKAIGSAIGVTAIILYWLIYTWMQSLAMAGDYRYFSYSFHELYSVGYSLVPLITLVWLISILVKTIKTHAWRRNLVLCVILGVMVLGHAGYRYQGYQQVHIISHTEVVEIPDRYHVVIQSGEKMVTLEASPTVTDLLQTDGTVYRFAYKMAKDVQTEGELMYVQQVR